MDNVAISDIEYLSYLSLSFNYSGSCCDRRIDRQTTFSIMSGNGVSRRVCYLSSPQNRHPS